MERNGRITKIRKVNDEGCKGSKKALFDMLSVLPESYRKSITYDNGSENMAHREINEILKQSLILVRLIILGRKGTLKTLMVLSGKFA